jgi:hypothetical protein
VPPTSWMVALPAVTLYWRSGRAGAGTAIAVVVVTAARSCHASIARNIDSISDRDSAPNLRRIRATWCSTVLAEISS